MENWYYLKNNKLVGPIAVSTLKEVLIDCTRKDNILVNRSPLKQWYRLSELSRFTANNSRFSTDLIDECSEIYHLYKSLEDNKPSEVKTNKYSTVNASDAIDRLKFNVQNELLRKSVIEKNSRSLVKDLSSFKKSMSSELNQLKTKISQNSMTLDLPTISSFSGRVRQILEG